MQLIYEDILAFIFNKTGYKANLNTEIFEDLGIDGLDAQIFMQDFFSKFNVDYSRYDYEKYSYNEADLLNIPKIIFNLLFNRKK